MNHRVGFNKLGLKESHRKSLHRNMATSLFKYERITTTKSKALAVKRTVEKMITRAKIDSVHNRRHIARDIKDKAILAKLFTEIAPRNENRPGGYTRILKLGPRKGDAAYMVILELVEREGGLSEKEKAPKKTKKATKKDEKTVVENKEKKAEAKSDLEVADVPVKAESEKVETKDSEEKTETTE
ncbi:MAG: 50S ribosomal protein L17 [Candidatus Heimdallarchaeaceae archaeon]